MADYYQRKAEQLNGRPVPEKAQAAKRRALARRQVVRRPAPQLFYLPRRRVWVLSAGVIMGSPWMKRRGNGVTCERLYGRPVPPPRPIVKRVKKIR